MRIFANIISPSILTFALFLLLIFAVVIPTMRRTIIERKKEMIRELTQAAWSELDGLHEQEKAGSLAREAAQQAAIASIQRLRYGDDGKDYFWLTDMQPRMIMHPYRPDLDGQDISTYADPAGKKLFVESVKVVHESGDCYIEYLWQWKDDESRIVPKLSYVKGFAPWGWIIGTGVYIEDVRAEIAQLTRRVLLVSVGICAIVAGLLFYITQQGVSLERQRAQAASALRESEEKYRALVEGATEGILLVMQGRPVYANKTLLNLLGHTEQELLSLPLDNILQSGPHSTAERHARLIKKTGDTVDVLVAAAPITLGERTGEILSLKDVTARRKTEESLARLLAELQSMLPLATRPINASPLTLTMCDLDTPIQKAATLMARARSSAILVKAPSGEPLGIDRPRPAHARTGCRRRPAPTGLDHHERAAGAHCRPCVVVRGGPVDAGARRATPRRRGRSRRGSRHPDRRGNPAHATPRAGAVARRNSVREDDGRTEGLPGEVAGVREGAA